MAYPQQQPRGVDSEKFTRDQCLKEHAALFQARTGSGLDGHLRDISEVLQPRRARLLYKSIEEGRKLNQKIINDTATWSLDVFAAGMFTGTASPARPWFRFVAADPDLNDYDPVRAWFDDADKVVRRILARSNFYDAKPLAYSDLGAWGTAATFMEADLKDVMRFYNWPIGSYAIALSDRLTVDTISRETRMTVGQIAQRFGLDNASLSLQTAFNRGDYFTSVRIMHTIKPNRDFDPSRADRRGKRWTSVWYEADATGDLPPLSIGNGFNEFPVAVPRWLVTGEDAYGESPAMRCLGDIKALQFLEKRKQMALDRIVNPPMNFPASMKSIGGTLLPGNANWIPDNATSKAEPTITVDPRVVFTRDEIAAHEYRIKRAFKVDLFMAIAQTEDQQKTAREIAERHEEKMLQIGPALNRVNTEDLTPQAIRTLNEAMRRGMLPPMPEELARHGTPQVESISLLEQAQKLLATAATERFVSYAGSVAAVNPEVLDLVDWDENVRDYADLVGLPADNLNSEDVVAGKRKQRAQQQQMAALASAAKPASDAANAASVAQNVDLHGDSSLARIVGAVVPGVQ